MSKKVSVKMLSIVITLFVPTALPVQYLKNIVMKPVEWTSLMNQALGSGISSTTALNKALQAKHKGMNIHNWIAPSSTKGKTQFAALNNTLNINIPNHYVSYVSDEGKSRIELVKNNYNRRLTKDARVRLTTELSYKEADLVKRRYTQAEYVFSDLCKKHNVKAPETTPRIAICASGGGFRAMITTGGFLDGLEKSGLLDTVLYSAVLSGSTWVTVPRALGVSSKTCLDTYKKYAKLEVGNLIGKSGDVHLLPQNKILLDHGLYNERQDIEDNIMRKFYGGQLIDATDIYGSAIVAHQVCAMFDDPSFYKNSLQPSYYPQPRQRLFLSQAREYLESDTLPFPIPLATAAAETTGKTLTGNIMEGFKGLFGYGNAFEESLQWFEFSPYEVGTFYLDKDRGKGAYVPTWAFGRNYEVAHKKKQNVTWYEYFTGSDKELDYIQSVKQYGDNTYISEYPLGNFLGLWGSAFAVSVTEVMKLAGLMGSNNTMWGTIAKTMAKYLTFGTGFMGQAVKSTLSGFRVFPFTTFNFLQFDPVSPCQDTYLTMVDAGIAHSNLPFVPLLGRDRNIDVIIAFDASSPIYSQDSQGNYHVDALEGIKKFTDKHGIAFPEIMNNKPEYTKIFSPVDGHNVQDIFVFKGDKAQGIPTIIYIPFLDNSRNVDGTFKAADCMKGNCNTFNFAYTEDNIDGAWNLVSSTVQDNIHDIVKAIAGHDNSN